MPVSLEEQRFEELVGRALDELPEGLAAEMDNVVILIEPHHPEEPELLGLYDGVALTDRDTTYGGWLPDRITIFRQPLLAMCDSEEELLRQVRITVVHEIAHHFGIDEQRLHELGWG